LKKLFPDKAEEIEEKVDPGEYGLENYWVRFVCMFIFVMSVMDDARSTLSQLAIIMSVPTAPEMWIDYDLPDWAPKGEVKEKLEKREIDFVRFKVAGMPLYWKLINLTLITVPKGLIWWITLTNGTVFLMDTAGIQDIIVNTMALAFILNLDETICDLFSHKAAHFILDRIEPFALIDRSDAERESDDDSLAALRADTERSLLSMNMIPRRMVFALFITALFICKYYMRLCEWSPRGGLVSRTMALPKYKVYPFLSFVLPSVFPEAEAGEEYWSMPEE